MHLRLPLIAGVPGRACAAALTVALLAAGCTPNFHAPEPAEIQPASASEALPAAVHNSAETTMRDAATVVVHQVAESRPPEETAPAGQVTEDDAATSQEPGADSEPAETDQEAEEAAAAEESEPKISQRRQSLDAWSASLTRAYESAQEHEQRQAEQEAQRQAEAEAEAEQRRQAEAERQAEQEEQPEPEQTQPPEPPVQNVHFDGDLNALLGQLAAQHPGRISISVQELGGQNRSASTGAADSFVTASTYKIFVAYSILREVEAGLRSWSDPVLGERDLAQCFHDMIVLSDNPCPEKLGPEIGWGNIWTDASAQGAANTRGGEGGIRTNAQDLTNFMTNLAAGNLAINGQGHDRLRNALGANVHRQGIPAGSAGQVLNKPGFINGNLHDTAIVHHPSGTYVLTILTQGSSWSSVAAITREIEAALYG
ncbi:serine hydrolase [Nesterenkonia ebinurensis]|uniref:serine hydrolase n=1 Tax=Nesterenkonia ebinurensis TaxID=2608252 RepID=UPI00123C802A|nr:serine hydrolase [Nesterenkonia ebinurensis]